MIYLLLLIPLVFGLWAQFRVKSAFSRYSQVRSESGISGAEAARRILAAANIRDVQVQEINGMLGDHYDPLHKRLCLSTDVFHSPSVAALGVAAHETGHAIQHAKAYAPLKLRMAVVPVVHFSSQILPFVVMGGFLFRSAGLVNIGIICYLVITLFALITLPVEFDASRRAKIILSEMGFVHQGAEARGVSRVLNAAAWTYVASFVAALGNLIYLLMISQRRNS